MPNTFMKKHNEPKSRKDDKLPDVWPLTAIEPYEKDFSFTLQVYIRVPQESRIH